MPAPPSPVPGPLRLLGDVRSMLRVLWRSRCALDPDVMRESIPCMDGMMPAPDGSCFSSASCDPSADPCMYGIT